MKVKDLLNYVNINITYIQNKIILNFLNIYLFCRSIYYV